MATRRRSPPESWFMGASSGGEDEGVGGDVDEAVEFPAVGGVDLFLELAHLLHKLVEVGLFLGVGHLGGDVVEAVDEVLDRFDGHQEVFADGLFEVDDGFLGDVADAHALGDGGGAVDIVVEAGHDLEEGRLARPVFADHADFCAVVEGEVDVFAARPFRQMTCCN